MPLPAYMTAQPTITPLEAVARRIQNLGHNVTLSRRGRTVIMTGMELGTGGHDVARKAIRIACEHADDQRLTIETAIPEVACNIVTDYEALGFRVVMEVGEDEDAERGAHCLLRRAAA